MSGIRELLQAGPRLAGDWQAWTPGRCASCGTPGPVKGPARAELCPACDRRRIEHPAAAELTARADAARRAARLWRAATGIAAAALAVGVAAPHPWNLAAWGLVVIYLVVALRARRT